MIHVVKYAAMLVVAALLGGCSSYPPLTLKVSGSAPTEARVRARLLEGEKAPTPTACEAPCSIQVFPDTSFELSLQADGYHHVVLPITYDHVWGAALSQEGYQATAAELVVPMEALP